MVLPAFFLAGKLSLAGTAIHDSAREGCGSKSDRLNPTSATGTAYHQASSLGCELPNGEVEGGQDLRSPIDVRKLPTSAVANS